jgi:N4-gp56 family major capsid protein
MKTFYSDYLIETAESKLVHQQFGQKKPIPQGNGKQVEFRKYDPLPKITTELQEGVTPNGQKLTITPVTATVKQYGGYVALTDVLLLTAIDNNLAQATKLLGSQAGATLDTITREVLNGGTNVVFAGGKSARGDLTATDVLKVDDIKKAVRLLKTQNAEPINGSWVAIIHPDVAYDLTNDPAWQNVKNYDPEDLYEGEIGRLYGVRFVETTEAKIFAKAGNGSRAVYSTLILGDNAYGTTEISGGGLEHIVKQLGSAGTSDPLNQRATAGWKATKVAERLVENYMVRIESASTFNPEANN